MHSAISYNAENISFTLKNKKIISLWINKIIELSGNKTGEIAYIFCDDKYLYQLNKKYLNHDTFTDIITFDYTEKKIISGDIFISLDRVRENADKYVKPFDNELLRVMSHGILHLTGYTDHTPSERLDMTAAEDNALKLFEDLKTFHVKHNKC